MCRYASLISLHCNARGSNVNHLKATVCQTPTAISSSFFPIGNCTFPELFAQPRLGGNSEQLFRSIAFEGNINDGEGVYELYLPASADVGKYQTRLLRNIYKLCGIEDREPADIVREMVVRHEEVKSPAVAADATRLRLQNSGTKPMQVAVDSPKREHTLYAQRSDRVDVWQHGETRRSKSQHSEGGLVIRTVPQRLDSLSRTDKQIRCFRIDTRMFDSDRPSSVRVQ